MSKPEKDHLWALDSEDDSKGHVTMINFFNGKEHFTFNIDDIKKKASKKEKSRILQSKALHFLTEINTTRATFWATNLQYDLINLFRHHLYIPKITYVGSRVISAEIEGTGIRFHDTMNHWKISVKEMGDRIGLKKIESKNFHNVEYCRRDTEITWRFVKKMSEAYEKIGCKLKSTIGSTALQYYYSEFGEKQRDRLFTKKHLEFMHRGYYGGRTEIFFTKPVTGKIHYMDFNSLYPAVSCELFPVLDQFEFTKEPDLNHEGMCDVTIELEPGILDVPYLPCRSHDGGLVFPAGKFRGVYTYFEIREALKMGYRLRKIHKAFEFQAGRFHPFKEFMEFVYDKRLKAQKENDSLMSDAFKLLMNNLYGKWGQGNESEELIPHEGNPKPGDLILGAMSLRKREGEYPIHTNKIWAAYTTAYGRHKLFHALTQVKKAGGLLIYCDTDSIIYESQDPIFQTKTGLGELKLEGVFEYAHFKLPKLYRLDEKFRAKGVPRNSAEEFFKKGRVKFKKPYKLRETLRRNMLAVKFNKRNTNARRRKLIVPNFWFETEKVSNKVYDKRRINTDGSTVPLIFTVKGGKNENTDRRDEKPEKRKSRKSPVRTKKADRNESHKPGRRRDHIR